MKIWKYLLSLAIVPFVLTACLKGDGWEEEHTSQPASNLSVELSTPSVLSGDEDYVEVTVRYEGEAVTEGVKFYTHDRSMLETAASELGTRAGEEVYDVTAYFVPGNGCFHLQIAYAGLFSFWAEYGSESTQSAPQSVKAVPEELYAELSKTTIVANGRDYAEVQLYYQGRRVTDDEAAEVKFFDMEDNPADRFFEAMRYRTGTVGEFSFWISYKALDTRSNPLTVTAEEPENDEIDVPSKGLFVYLSTTLIRADGADAVRIKVFFDGDEVTDQASYYRLPDNTEVDLSNGRYTATTAGTFSFWVAYKTENTISTPSTITAVDFEIPDRPTDPNPSSTNFVRRVQALQFTGTGCGYCPLMMTSLRNMAADASLADKFLVAACHSYNASDPMYLGSGMSNAFGINSYPTVVMDMRSVSTSSAETYVRNLLGTNYNRTEALAGIAVHSEMSGNTVVAHVVVKAAREKSFRVGVMVLEDGIYASQSNYNNLPGDFNTHNNTIRLVDATRTYKGYELGTIKPGAVVDQLFALNIDEKWNQENCRLMVYVCADEGSGVYVNNVIATDALVANRPFEYAE